MLFKNVFFIIVCLEGIPTRIPLKCSFFPEQFYLLKKLIEENYEQKMSACSSSKSVPICLQVLRATGKVVKLSLERYLRGPKFEQLQQAIAASELKPPTPNSPSAASLPRFPVSTVSS